MRNMGMVGSGLLIVILLALLAGCGSPAGPRIRAEDVWSRPAMAMKESGGQTEGQGGMGIAGTGAVFMRLVNEGSEADRLIGGKTDVAKVVEIHETVMENDVMKMQMLSGGLEIPATGEVLLKPGSYHIMLIGMEKDLKPGDTFTLELEFERSGTLTLETEVREF